MHVLLPGGTGFVGTAVRRALDARSISYTTLSRSPQPGDSHVQADITDRDRVLASARAADVVVNLVAASPLLPAGNSHVYLHRHLRGVECLLDVLSSLSGVRLIHVGALGVEEASGAGYAWTKARAERLVRESSLPALVLSPAILYGAGSELIAALNLMARLPVSPLPRIASRFQPLSVDDLATLIADAVVSFDRVADPGTRQVEVGGPEVMSGTEFARRFLQARGAAIVELPSRIVNSAIRLASALRLPGFPVDLPRMLAMQNAATGRFPLYTTRARYDDWLATMGN